MTTRRAPPFDWTTIYAGNRSTVPGQENGSATHVALSMEPPHGGDITLGVCYRLRAGSRASQAPHRNRQLENGPVAEAATHVAPSSMIMAWSTNILPTYSEARLMPR